jgi:hypothetical protein
MINGSVIVDYILNSDLYSVLIKDDFDTKFLITIVVIVLTSLVTGWVMAWLEV